MRIFQDESERKILLNNARILCIQMQRAQRLLSKDAVLCAFGKLKEVYLESIRKKKRVSVIRNVSLRLNALLCERIFSNKRDALLAIDDYSLCVKKRRERKEFLLEALISKRLSYRLGSCIL
jgi:dihydroorotase